MVWCGFGMEWCVGLGEVCEVMWVLTVSLDRRRGVSEQSLQARPSQEPGQTATHLTLVGRRYRLNPWGGLDGVQCYGARAVSGSVALVGIRVGVRAKARPGSGRVGVKFVVKVKVGFGSWSWSGSGSGFGFGSWSGIGVSV